MALELGGGIGHNLPQEAPAAFASAVRDVAAMGDSSAERDDRRRSPDLEAACRKTRQTWLGEACLPPTLCSLPLFVAGMGVRAGLDHNAAWDILSDPQGRGPALLLRAASIGRDEAAAILLLLNTHGRLFSGTEGEVAAEQLDLFDGMDEASSSEILRLWRADPAYRASVARISTRGVRSAEAA